MAKILVCLFSQGRADKLCFDSFNKHVLKTLNADLLTFFEKDKSNKNNLYVKRANYKYFNEKYSDFGFAIDKICNSFRLSDLDWREVLNIKSNWLGGIKGKNSQKGSAAILIYYRYMLGLLLKKEKIIYKYDFFVLSRSDFMWQLPHPPVSFFRKNIGLMYGEHYAGYSDRHMIIPREFLIPILSSLEDIIFNRKKLISEMSHFKEWNLESFLYYTIKTKLNSVKIKYFPYSAFLVRDANTKTTWSPGVFNKKLNLFVKYPSEYALVEISKKIYKVSRGYNTLRAKFFYCNFFIRFVNLQCRDKYEAYFRLSFLLRHNLGILNVIKNLFFIFRFILNLRK
jgi:hypothetical protein